MTYADVRTQAMYQLLDAGFIGLIFSCFNEDVHKVCLNFFYVKLFGTEAWLKSV